MCRYHSATAKQQTHCSFAVTLEDIKKQVADDGFDGVQSRAASPFQIMPETWSPGVSRRLTLFLWRWWQQMGGQIL